MTFTILGRCARTGQLGGAVTTSDIAVGARVLYAEAALAVVATQHRTDPRLGPALLDRLRAGARPDAAVAQIAAATPDRHWRQLGVLDAAGDAAAYSGSRLWPVGAELADRDCLVLANMLAGNHVAPAMRDAFRGSAGDALADRLLSALVAGEHAGGERDGALRSAALLIVARERFPFVDLRIDDARDPLACLQALWESYRPHAREFVARALAPDDVPAPEEPGPPSSRGHRSSSTTT
jgi:uncharacterized Ntn-hydrolase superfamily protein